MKLRRTVLGLCCSVAFSSFAATPVPVGRTLPVEDQGLLFITAEYQTREQLQDIASRFQHMIVDEASRTVRMEASFDELMALRNAGFAARIDEKATTQLRESEAAMAVRATGVDGVQANPNAITGYACYRTVEETYATAQDLAMMRPQLARVLDIGPSWAGSVNSGSGYRMRVLELTNSATNARYPNKPSMVLFGSIHAREYTPAELLTRFAEGLANGHGTEAEATWLLDNFRFHFVLQANPDGRKRAEAGSSWRKNVNSTNGSCSSTSHGIDLNRNFPFQWNGAGSGSSSNPCAGTYRGPLRVSEPETQNLLRYVAGTPDAAGVYRGGVLPDRRGDSATSAAPSNYRGMFLDVHSYSRLVLWPWSYSTTPPPNAAALQTLGRRIAWFNGYTPKQWTGLYKADGTTTDTMYGLLGVPSFTIELGVAFFESCSTFQNSTLPRNLSALRYAARNLQAPYLYPAGPDTTSVRLAEGQGASGTTVTVTATIDSSRFSQANGVQSVSRVAAAHAYLNRRPWEGLTYAVQMSASDGAFSSSREVVNVTIPTSGLPSGRHVVFVRGTAANGRVGTPQAAYFVLP